MNVSPPSRARPARLLASTVLLLAVGLVTVGCQTTQSPDPAATSAMAAAPPSRDDADPRGAASAWGERYRANPNDQVAAINYAAPSVQLFDRIVSWLGEQYGFVTNNP